MFRPVRAVMRRLIPVSLVRQSAYCEVTQRRVRIGASSTDPALAAFAVEQVAVSTPKFTLINHHLRPEDIAAFDCIVVCDDNVRVCRAFIDRLIGWQQHCGFALAQPARTWKSFVDHRFVRQRLVRRVRETRFVEIGPVRGDPRHGAPGPDHGRAAGEARAPFVPRIVRRVSALLLTH